MRWIMNALLLAACGLAVSSSSLMAQTPDQAPQPAPAGGAQQPNASDDDQAPRSDSDTPQRDEDGERRVRGRGGPAPLGGPGFGPGPRMMMARLPLMAALDADGDGEISASEIDGAVAALKKLDKNSDGKLTMDELMPEGMRGPMGPGGPGNFDPERMVERMMAADANGDGFIDQDEMPERMKMMLDRADTDKDGKLSKDELIKMVSQLGAGRRPGGFGPRGNPDGRGNPETPRGDSDEPGRRRRPASE